jgi:RHS repeat-associated protein
VNLGEDPLATYSYNLAGQQVGLVRANGVATAWNYNGAGSLLSIAHATGSRVVASTSYAFAVSGRRVARSEADGWTERYEYDAAGQLTGTDYFESPTARQAARVVSYAYDALGNRTRMAEVDRSQGGSDRNSITHYTANVLNQYTRITLNGVADTPVYDANGNLTRQGGVDYRYNARSQLIEVTTATERMAQVHDPKGRVVERRYFTKGPQGQWIEHADKSLRLVYDAWNVIEDCNMDSGLRARYIHGSRIDEILAMQIPNAEDPSLTVSYPLADGLGSTVALTDVAGAPTQRFRYDAFGTPHVLSSDYRQQSTGSVYRFLFTGREWLGIAGLQDNRNRQYDSQAGRWLSPDPIGFKGGNNLYGYALNQPIWYNDPMGLTCSPGRQQCLDDCTLGGTACALGCPLECIFAGPAYLACLGACETICGLLVASCNAYCYWHYW